jgi:hypothetical protein
VLDLGCIVHVDRTHIHADRWRHGLDHSKLTDPIRYVSIAKHCGPCDTRGDLLWLSYAVSRPAIERAVRARMESRANTTLRQRCRVQEVLASPNGEAVTGATPFPAAKVARIGMQCAPSCKGSNNDAFSAGRPLLAGKQERCLPKSPAPIT